MKKNKFKQFKDEGLRLQKVWGLTNWKLYFEDIELPYDVAARIRTTLDGYVATIQYDSKKGYPPKEQVKHEMVHLLLARLSDLGTSRFIREDEFCSAEEEVVRILEKLL